MRAYMATAAAVFVVAAGLAGCSPMPGSAPEPSATTSLRSTATTLPPMTHFRLGEDGGVTYDCHTRETAVDCHISWDNRLGGMNSYGGDFTGSLSGMTMTGTSRIHTTSWDQMDPACTFSDDIAGPISYTFFPDGTGTLRDGPAEWRRTNSGSCTGSDSGTHDPVEFAFPWTKLG